ncbi:hypothetical protein FKR81_36455 [Lentzea tibetensis]|uniref:Uncharacterized protein n=1 Tax=Lentzea tibetensis TaxID=2591470 RepID=A0A563EI43_9PSEU|nr:DUF6236 family protein [Lentzea tibetensis]TWP46234.1 hypothetical protein FKR81_36455 [Lentzea tibetensis]
MNEFSGTVHGNVLQAGTIHGDVHIHGRAEQRLDPIALYYPYIHVRDDTWLKYAALYWPKLGRLLPNGYPARDSAVAVELDRELKWVLNIQPYFAAMKIGDDFLDLVVHHAEALRHRYGIQDVHDWQVDPDGGSSAGTSRDLNPRYSYVHLTKIRRDLVEAIVDAGLGHEVGGHGGDWLGLHPKLAGVYMCALTEEVAREERMHPVTDRALTHAALSGWTMERLAEVLLGSSHDTRPTAGDPIDRFVVAAFQTVVPANMASVPVEKIIEVRKRYRRELNGFREYVAAQLEAVTGLGDVRDVAVYRAHLDYEVERKISDKLDDLRDLLLDMGLEPATALATVKAPLDVRDTTTETSERGTLATRVVEVPQRLRDQTIRSSPVGYLFHLGERLSASALADQVTSAMQT